jgi:hypothetical protein
MRIHFTWSQQWVFDPKPTKNQMFNGIFNHVNPNNKKKRRQKLYTKGTNIKKSLNELRNDHRLEKKTGRRLCKKFSKTVVDT